MYSHLGMYAGMEFKNMFEFILPLTVFVCFHGESLDLNPSAYQKLRYVLKLIRLNQTSYVLVVWQFFKLF